MSSKNWAEPAFWIQQWLQARSWQKKLRNQRTRSEKKEKIKKQLSKASAIRRKTVVLYLLCDCSATMLLGLSVCNRSQSPRSSVTAQCLFMLLQHDTIATLGFWVCPHGRLRVLIFVLSSSGSVLSGAIGLRSFLVYGCGLKFLCTAVLKFVLSLWCSRCGLHHLIKKPSHTVATELPNIYIYIYYINYYI